jgi:hypothetical protein
MIADSVRFCAEQGREVVYDAEHFFDGYAADRRYAMRTLEAAERGSDVIVLCDTNGGRLPAEIEHFDWIVFLPQNDGSGAYNQYHGRLSNVHLSNRAHKPFESSNPRLDYLIEKLRKYNYDGPLTLELNRRCTRDQILRTKTILEELLM